MPNHEVGPVLGGMPDPRPSAVGELDPVPRHTSGPTRKSIVEMVAFQLSTKIEEQRQRNERNKRVDCVRLQFEFAQRILVALRAAKPADEGLLAEFGKHLGWELSYAGWDEEAEWRVHCVTGGRNDQEWTLIGSGQSPAEAIDAALSEQADAPCPDCGDLPMLGSHTLDCPHADARGSEDRHD